MSGGEQIEELPTTNDRSEGETEDDKETDLIVVVLWVVSRSNRSPDRDQVRARHVKWHP